MPSTWMEFATPSANNMQPTPGRKPRPTHGSWMNPDDRARYFRTRAAGQAERFLDQRLRRLGHGWERESFDDPYPVPGLQRLLSDDVRPYGDSYYCVASQSYCQTSPPDCAHVPHRGLLFYRAEVYTYLDVAGEPDPCIARVHCLTVRGLRNRVRAALAAFGTEGDGWGLAGITPAWRQTLEELILHPATAAPTRINVFRRLLDKLNRNECEELAQHLKEGIDARQPGAPGYAVLHGLSAPAVA